MYKAGTASEKITPDEPLWLAGYAARTEPARGKISDLYTSALALEDRAGTTLVIASIDLIALTKPLVDQIQTAVQNQIGLPRERLILAASHTHFGPEVRTDKVPFFNIPDEYAKKIPAVAQQIIDALVRVIVASTKNLEPVRLFARKSSAGFAHNRRREGVKDGTPSPLDILDHDVPILDVLHADTGLRKSIVFGYACHNTTIPPEDCRYSSDWAGVAKEQLQRAHPGCTPLFITGCGADQNPEPRGSVELSNRYGHELASAIQSTIADGPVTEITGPIRAAMEDVPLPMEPMTDDILQRMLTSNDPPQQRKAKYLLAQIARGEPLLTAYPAATQVVRFGSELLLIALSSEVVVDWAIKFKQDFANVANLVWVAGYCNDMYGYVPTRRVQKEGGYEAGRAVLWSWMPSPFTPDVEDRLTQAVHRLVERTK